MTCSVETVKYTNEENFQCLEDLYGSSSELSLVHVGRENCKPYHVFSGTRDEYIIHFITKGQGFYSCNGNAWPLTAGQMFLIYPGDTVVYCSDSKDPWSYCWIGFRGFRVEQILKQCGFSRSRLTLPNPDLSQLLPCFDEMLTHITLEPYDDFFRESLLLKIFSILSLHYTELTKSHALPQDIHVKNMYVNQAIEFINGNYMRGISVTDIADQIGISRTHLNHVFQEELNLSVQSFLIDYRMYRAASLLSHTAMPIKEISDQVGYSDPLVFSKAFKKKFNLSPKQYREDSPGEQSLEVRDKRPDQQG